MMMHNLMIALLVALPITFTSWMEARALLTEALIGAVREGDDKTIKVLLVAGTDAKAKDYTGMTVLMYAAMLDHAQAVKSLLRSGADVNAKDMNGRTALMRAAWTGDAEIVQVLLDQGADPHAEDNDHETAFLWAAKNDHPDAMRLLERASAHAH